MHLKNKVIYNQTSIYYNIVLENDIQSLFLNYLSIVEINKLKQSNAEIFQKMTFIHMIITTPSFRNKKIGTSSLIYFKKICPQYPIILFCENNYVNFNLIDWYKSFGFVEKYSNLESTILLHP